MSFTKAEAEMLILRASKSRVRVAEKGNTRRHKYNATSVFIDQIRFPSIAEGEYYRQLKLRRRAGDVRYFLMQVPFTLPGPVRVRVDFMEVLASGEIRYIDVKGKVTQAFVRNCKQVKRIFGVDIVAVFYDYRSKTFYER